MNTEYPTFAKPWPLAATYFARMQVLQYDNIIAEVNKLFPDFAKDEELSNLTEDLPGVHLSFLISYVRENWNDLQLQDRLAGIANDLSQSNDETTNIVFLDFALDLQLHFQEHGISLEAFLTKLLPTTKLQFESTLFHWNNANKKYKSGSS